MATVPKIPLPVHEIENVLAFDQEKIVKSQQTQILGTLDTSRFDKIRLVAANESTCNVHLWLKIMGAGGGQRREEPVRPGSVHTPATQPTDPGLMTSLPPN